MSNIAHDLREFLLSEPAVTDLTDSVFRNDIPPGSEPPYVRIQRFQANSDLTRDGAGDLYTSVFSVDCFGGTQDEADDLSDAVRLVLEANPDTMGDSTIRGVFVRDKSDDYTPFPDASDRVLPWSSMDAEIWHV